MSGSTRWLVLAAAAVAILVVVGVGASAMGGRATVYPEGSPERAVQQYLQAIADRDSSAALAFYTADLNRRCTDAAYLRDSITNRGTRSVRAALEESTLRDGTARVRVSITESYGDDPFGGGESTQTQVFVLRQEGGAWRIAEPAWPIYCPLPVPAIMPPAVPTPAPAATPIPTPTPTATAIATPVAPRATP